MINYSAYLNNSGNPFVRNYLNYIKDKPKTSKNTISAYTRDLKDFERYIKKLDSRVSLKNVSSDDIDGYRDYLLEKFSVSTVNRKLSVIKGFYKYLILEGDINYNPIGNISFIGDTDNKPKVLSVKKICNLLDSMPMSTPSAIRDRAIMEVLYGCGLRVSELCDLDTSKCMVEEGFLLIAGKNDKERMAPISGVAAEILTKYLREARENFLSAKNPCDAVFLNVHGSRLSRQSVHTIVKDAGKSVKIKNLYPHTLRHSYAAHMLKGGADIRAVKDILGHADMSTMKMYQKKVRRVVKK